MAYAEIVGDALSTEKGRRILTQALVGRMRERDLVDIEAMARKAGEEFGSEYEGWMRQVLTDAAEQTSIRVIDRRKCKKQCRGACTNCA